MSKIKNAFDFIKADEKLKAKTLSFLQSEIKLQNRHQNKVKKLVLISAPFVFIFTLGIFLYNFCFTPYAYLDIDINPSIELAINRFNMVINTYAYNSDGEHILSNVKIKYKNYNDAMQLLIDIVTENGYLEDGGLVIVTLQANDSGKESELLESIGDEIGVAVTCHHISAQVDVFSVNEEIKSTSHILNVSPAKYLAILELQEVDPTATLEGCINHTIREIRQFTQEHKNHGGNSYGNGHSNSHGKHGNAHS